MSVPPVVHTPCLRYRTIRVRVMSKSWCGTETCRPIQLCGARGTWLMHGCRQITVFVISISFYVAAEASASVMHSGFGASCAACWRPLPFVSAAPLTTNPSRVLTALLGCS